MSIGWDWGSVVRRCQILEPANCCSCDAVTGPLNIRALPHHTSACGECDYTAGGKPHKQSALSLITCHTDFDSGHSQKSSIELENSMCQAIAHVHDFPLAPHCSNSLPRSHSTIRSIPHLGLHLRTQFGHPCGPAWDLDRDLIWDHVPWNGPGSTFPYLRRCMGLGAAKSHAYPNPFHGTWSQLVRSTVQKSRSHAVPQI
jgi:hypothetical protein